MVNQSTNSITIQCGFEDIFAPASLFRETALRLGKALTVKHIFNVKEEQRKSGELVIFERCVRSTNLSEAPYLMELQLDPHRNVVGGRCSCVAGIDYNCKHSAALVHYVNSSRSESCTSREQHQPNKKAKQMYPMI